MVRKQEKWMGEEGVMGYIFLLSQGHWKKALKVSEMMGEENDLEE